MKKIALGLVALAALSSTAFAAGNRSWDLQDRQYYNTDASVDGNTGSSVTVTEQAPFALQSSASAGSAYDRALIRSQEREQGDR